MFEAYAALGANLGDRERSLREAVRRLAATEGIEVRRCSALYETDPVGYTEQPAFLNMAAALGTNLCPLELLRVMLGIEREMGRVRDIRFGPRTIDLDLLLYEGIELDTEELALPHPRMGERAFVLVPLRDVWADGPEAFPWNGLLTEPVLKEAGIKIWAPWGGVPKER